MTIDNIKVLIETAQALTRIEPVYHIQTFYVDDPNHTVNKIITFHFDG